MIIEPHKMTIIFALLFALAAFLVARSLNHVSAATGNTYNLTDLLIDDTGKASRAAHVLLGGFAVTSWYFVYAGLTGKMTDTLYATYCLTWIAPAVTKLITGAK